MIQLSNARGLPREVGGLLSLLYADFLSKLRCVSAAVDMKVPYSPA